MFYGAISISSHLIRFQVVVFDLEEHSVIPRHRRPPSEMQ